jgi:hypothetical protein
MIINKTTKVSNLQSNIINKVVANSSIEKKSIKDDEFDLNQKITAIDMYNSTLGSLGGVFKNNEKLKDNIISSMGKMTVEERLGFVMITLPFKVGNIETGVPEKDKTKEFATMNSASNYFKSLINDLQESEDKYGGDTSEARTFVSNLLEVIENSQKQEQETNYIELGKAKTGNV